MVYQFLQRYGTQQFRACANAIRRVQCRPKQRAKRVVLYTLISRSHYTKSAIPLVNQDLSLELCGAVAALLNGAGIENLLWGTNLQAAYTVPTIILELSFIVGGNQLQEAIIALESESFLLCRDKSCSLNMPRDCQKSSFDNPHAHFHLDISRSNLLKNYGIVRLYTMEDKLWELPVFGRGVDFTDNSSNNIIFANDASLIVGTGLQGIGRFPDSVSGVRIPTLHRYVEALILLAIRCGPSSLSASAWVSELVYVVHLVNMDRLGHPAFRQFCARVLKGGAGFKTMIMQAQEALGPRIRKDTHWNDIQKIRATWA